MPARIPLSLRGQTTITTTAKLLSKVGKTAFASRSLVTASSSKSFDVVVAGGGAMGSSVAFHLLKADPTLKVCVVEKDPTYKIASSPLSVGSIRQQFSISENTRMSMMTAKFLKESQHEFDPDVAEPIHFEEGGYLVLGTEKSRTALQANHIIQRQQNAKVKMLPTDEMRQKFPWLNTRGLAVGSWGYENEGWFDPYSMMMWFKKHAIALGALYMQGTVSTISRGGEGNKISSVRVDSTEPTTSTTSSSSSSGSSGSSSSSTVIGAGALVNTGGCWAAQIAEMAGIPGVPIVPRLRRVFVFHCPEAEVSQGEGVPMVFDPSGLWFRREGAPEAVAEELEGGGVNDTAFFEEHMWEPLANRVPAFENLRQVGGWHGFYDFNKFDENAIIGEYQEGSRLYFAAGFSGHGIQHCPPVGRAISELILDGRYSTVDLSSFGYNRVLQNVPFTEAVCY
eukprot:jgi/Bigna1/38746/e_gw1.28.139.1